MNASPLDPNDVLRYLEKRVGVLDGVAVTGGEPLLQKDIGDFLGLVKEYWSDIEALFIKLYNLIKDALLK